MNAPAVTNQTAAELRHQLDGMRGQFEAALPPHIPVDRFMRVVMTTVQNNPDLGNQAKVTRRSLWNACMKAAQDGLLPDNREAAIVKYGDQAQYLPMIAGLRKKVRNSGEIATWDAQVVHQKDEFQFRLGDDPVIHHVPSLEAEPGPVVAAYSIATLKSGEKSCEVMSISAIEKVRERSRASKAGPWLSDYDEMCRKTVARRHAKVLPMSTDLDDLMRRDDDLYDFEGAKEEAQQKRPKSLSGRLDAIAASPAPQHVTEDGEIIEEPESGDPGVPEKAAVSEFQHSAPVDAGPETAADSKPGPNVGPKTEREYVIWSDAWIDELTNDRAGAKRWVDEMRLRNACNVSPEIRDAQKEKLESKLADLRR